MNKHSHYQARGQLHNTYVDTERKKENLNPFHKNEKKKKKSAQNTLILAFSNIF